MEKYLLLVQVHVHAACPSQYTLRVISTLHVHAFAADPCPCCMSMSVLHGFEHFMDKDMQHGH
jgi:hypothetical protein